MSVTVLMSVFNNETRIEKTLNSILKQTYPNFELLIINDGSTDNTCKILRDYAMKDKRIIIIDKSNTGLTDSLNIGLKASNNDLIIRHDAEDISHPERFEILVNLINKNRSITCIATSCFILDTDYKIIGYYPLRYFKSLNKLIDTNKSRIAHPSVIFRKRDVLYVGGYPNVYRGQDYALWKLLRQNNFNFLFIHKPLYGFLREKSGITYSNYYEQIRNVKQLSGKEFSENIINKIINDKKMKDHILYNIDDNYKINNMKLIYFKLLKYYKKYKLIKYRKYKKDFEHYFCYE